MRYTVVVGWYTVRMKPMTVRQSDEQASELELVARVDGTPIAQVVQAAIDAYLVARRADPGFQVRLQQRLKEDQRVARRLTG